MEHERLLLLALVALQPLSLVGGAQCGCHQRLRFATSKQRRSVCARQHAGFDGNLTNLVEGAAIRSDPILCHLLAEDPLAQFLIIVSQLLFGRWIISGKRGCQLVLDLLDQRLAFQLLVHLGVQRVLETNFDLALQLTEVGLVELRLDKGPLGLAGQSHQLVDGGDNLLDFGVAKLDGCKNRLFRLFFRA